MIINTKNYKKSDYPELSRWWKESCCPIPHESQLDTLGVIGYQQNTPTCAVFAYRCSDVPIVFLEHFVTNPDVEGAMVKMKAVLEMMSSILGQLEEDGYQMVRGTTWSKTLGKVCKRYWGFQIIDDGCTNMSLMLN